MKTLIYLNQEEILEAAEKAVVTATTLVAQMEDPRIRRHQNFLEHQLAICQRILHTKPGIVRGECAEIISAAIRLNREVHLL